MLTIDTSHLENRKNLLAFSSGVDSSALFFLLIEHNIKFDIAIVNYGLREQSLKELEHAQKLAKDHKLFCHHIHAPKFESHFEQKAREFRYEFFESLIQIEGYDNLLTAHQLNDQLEWLLMRLSKGAGLTELLGLTPIAHRKNYTLIRPLLQYTKQELLDYLNAHQYPYFIDSSNGDPKYERNRFRKSFSDDLIEVYSEGIKRSFIYLQKDKETLESTFETRYKEKELVIIQLYDMRSKAKAADLTLKQLGYLLSSAQRKEIEKESSVVIGGEWAVELQGELLYIAPYCTETLTKEFKEKCRRLKIPAKIRPYLFTESIELSLPLTDR
jgi:tRNA(Ile)-lysidine synthase